MGLEPAQVPVIPPAVVLMEVFKLVAQRSLLGFAMVVDIFERTSYREEDPLTSLLNKSTFTGKSTTPANTKMSR